MILQGSLLRDGSRAEVGRVRAILLDPDSLDARWLEVSLADGRGSAVVPAAAVSEFAVGELLVPYLLELVAQAVHEAGAPLTVEKAHALRRHYGFSD